MRSACRRCLPVHRRWRSGVEEVSWNLTVSDGTTEKVLSLPEIRALPAWEGYGHAVSTVGIMYGPYTVKGVRLTTLVESIGGFGAGDQVGISAPDGYYWVFDDEQMAGSWFGHLRPEPQEKLAPALTLLFPMRSSGGQIPYD